MAAMNGISDSFEQAVKYMGDVLAITGRIYPITEDNIFLVAEPEDGTQIEGIKNCPQYNSSGKIKQVMLDKVVVCKTGD